MSQSYFTQTPNFISASSSDVDPRTRLFGFNHSLTTLVGNYDMGPSLDLTLTYSPTTTDNSWAMGIGVMFSMTWYDKNDQTLYLNSGETYKVNESTDGSQPPSFEIKQCKLKTFQADKVDSGGAIWYRITDHDGNITELYEVGAGYFRPKTIWSPLGRRLYLTWSTDGGNAFLSQVTDDNSTVLFSALYDKNSAAPAMTLLPDSDAEQTLTLSTSGGYLMSMANSALTDQGGTPVPWTFAYNQAGTSGLKPLNKITMPTGLVKEVIYDMEAMLFPDNASQAPLPAVTQLTVSPGLGSPDIVTHWAFNSEENKVPNYLGYGGNQGNEDWSDDKDNCYTLLDSDYIYYSVSSQDAADGGNPVTTIYAYNNYHLLLSTETTQGDNVHTVDTTWFAVDGASFDEQPANYQCPKLQKETWKNATSSYSRYTAYTYDDLGNLTKQVNLADENGDAAANSTVIKYEFYTAEGEKDSDDKTTGCPEDPYGFVCRPKMTTTTPPSVNGYKDVPVRITYYRYAEISTLNNTFYSTAVMPVQDTYCGSDVNSDTQVLLCRENTYDTTTSSPHYGRQTQQKATIYDLDPDSSTPTYIQTLDSAWSFSADQSSLIQEDTLTTHDGLSVSASVTRLCLTGKPISFTDPLGNITELSYDSLGRLAQETRNSGTEYQTDRYSDYALERSGTEVSAIKTTIRDNAGNQSLTLHDGMGRPIEQKHNANDAGEPDTWKKTGTITWDAWGRKHSNVSTDYTDPTGGGDTLSITDEASFDDWGQQILATYSTGQQHSEVWDPIHLTGTSQLQVTSGSLSLSSQQVVLKEDKMTDTQNILNKSGKVYATTVKEYDGLGRLRKTTDPLNNVTHQTYDPFDRVSTSTLPDGAIQSWTYAPFSYTSLPVSVAVQKSASDPVVIMGTQTFDGLGRITGSSCGGRSHSAVYSGANRVPETTTDAAGQTLSYTYISALSNAISGVTGTTISQTFSYFQRPADGSSDPDNTGRLQSSSEQGSRSNVFSWFPSGHPSSQEYTSSSSSSVQSGNTWTLMGLPLTQTDVAGNLLTLGYNANGQLKTLTDPEVTVTLKYDDAGRLTKQTVEQNGGTDTLTTALKLDDFGRETQRTITPSSGDGLQIATTYNTLSQVVTLTTTTTQSGEILRDETFTYDIRNRLTDYTCTGSTPPQDAYGQTLSELHFTLDVYSNITACTTKLADGSTDNATYQYTNPDDPCQLSAVTHSLTSVYPASITLKYDANGRMTTDEAGRTLSYDEAGRLTHITGQDGESEYAYDAFDMLVMQCLNSNDTRELYYSGNRLLSEVHVEQNQITRNIPGAWGTSAVSDETLS